MPTRELMNRLVEIENWDNIPNKNKRGKKPYIYFKKGRTYDKAVYISYQNDSTLQEMCESYIGNVILKKFPGPYMKKYKGKDKIYIDPLDIYVKDLKKLKKKNEKKRGGILLDF